MKNQENRNEKNKTNKGSKGAIIGFVATGILGATTLGLGIAYGITQGQASGYSMQLENIYKKNYYELVDSVNSSDMQISKLLASDNEDYQAKMLSEISQNAKEMQSSIAALPLTGENILESVRFINQMSGYSKTLEDKVSKGGSLTEQDLKTLNDMHESLTEMKRYLNHLSNKMLHGYSILEASSRMNGEYDEFTLDFAQVKTDDADYPTMIYDGPFSDSVVNQKVKGLSGSEMSKEDVYKRIDEIFKNVSSIKYQGQTDGRFNTYNYTLTNSDGQKLYVQATKIGGHVLTVSGSVESDVKNISKEQAEKIALDFAKENGVEDATIVWDEILKSQAYFNIAPKQNGIILYPDLVKVKIDMEKGDVIGYDSIAYWTNHTDRTLSNALISFDKARENINDSFNIKNERLCLSPLDYNREVLCLEFECERNGSTYYIYLNAQTGKEENILKVVKTDDGSKLM